jgi:predicted DNA-binding WGR domain protein
VGDMGSRQSVPGRDTGRHPPVSNEWRYYRMAVWPDLFGRALLVRQWGRIGTEGRRRLDPHPDPGAAINALAGLLRIKRRRGYQDRSE